MADGDTLLERSGRTVRIEPVGETLTVLAPDGRVEIELRLTPQGVVLVATGPLRLAAPQGLELGARDVTVRAENELRLEGREVFVQGELIHLN